MLVLKMIDRRVKAGGDWIIKWKVVNLGNSYVVICMNKMASHEILLDLLSLNPSITRAPLVRLELPDWELKRRERL